MRSRLLALGLLLAASSGDALGQAGATVFLETFDPAIHSELWAEINGGYTSTNAEVPGPRPAGNSLRMRSGPRLATTIPLNVSAGGEVSFRFAVGLRDDEPWEEVWPWLDSVILQYSVDGTTFVDLAGEFRNREWQQFSIPIPADAQTHTTQFRFRLPAVPSWPVEWVLDDFRVGSPGVAPIITTLERETFDSTEPLTLPIRSTPPATAYEADGLPDGLTLDSLTGLISGTPDRAGAHLLTLRATNAFGTTTKPLVLSLPDYSGSVALYTGGVSSHRVRASLDRLGVMVRPFPFLESSAHWEDALGSGVVVTAGLSDRPNTAAREVINPRLEAGRGLIVTGRSGSTNQLILNGLRGWSLVNGAVIGEGNTVTRAPGAPGFPNSPDTLNVPAGGSCYQFRDSSLPPEAVKIFGAASDTGVFLAGPVVHLGYSWGAGFEIDGWDAVLRDAISALRPLLDQPPIISSPLLRRVFAGQQFSHRITATGQPSAFGAGPLPAGLSFDPSTGVLAGALAETGFHSLSISATNLQGTTSASMLFEVVPSLAAFDEDFDPGIDPSLWAAFGDAFKANETAQAAGPGSSGNSLLIHDTDDPRFAVTNPIDTRSAELLSFSLVLGSSGGPSSWRFIPSDQGVVVEYTIDGVDFVPLGGPYWHQNWQSHAVLLPPEAKTLVTQFRFRQLRPEGTNRGTWALDDIHLGPPRRAPDISSDLTAHLYSGTSFGFQVESTGLPASYTATGLPAGLAIDPGTGLITGSTEEEGVYLVQLSATNAHGTATAELTLTVEDAIHFFFDDFDPGLDPDLWDGGFGLFVANTTGTAAGPGSTGNSLWAGSGSGRWISTKPVDARPGGTVSFRYASGNDVEPWERIVPGEEVYLEYSIDLGTTYLPMGGPFVSESWQRFDVEIPPEARTSITRFRFRQGYIIGESAGEWALDDVRIGMATEPPVVSSPLSLEDFTSFAISYRIDADNEPTGFEVTGLPAGLTFDPLTRVISGAVLEPGEYLITLTLTNVVGTTVETLRLVVRDGITSFYDDFDPDVDTALWAALNGGARTQVFGSLAGPGSTDRILWFGGSDERSALTVPLDVRAGGEVSFLIAHGNWDRSTWEGPQAGQETVLEYTVDNGATYHRMGGPYLHRIWAVITEPIPPEARSRVAQFRFRQLAHGGSGTDHWALEEVQIGLPALPPKVHSPLTADAFPGRRFSYQLVLTGSPTDVEVTGLPAGLLFDPDTRVVSGIPIVPGVFDVTLQASNAAGTTTESLQLEVHDRRGTVALYANSSHATTNYLRDRLIALGYVPVSIQGNSAEDLNEAFASDLLIIGGLHSGKQDVFDGAFDVIRTALAAGKPLLISGSDDEAEEFFLNNLLGWSLEDSASSVPAMRVPGLRGFSAPPDYLPSGNSVRTASLPPEAEAKFSSETDTVVFVAGQIGYVGCEWHGTGPSAWDDVLSDMLLELTGIPNGPPVIHATPFLQRPRVARDQYFSFRIRARNGPHTFGATEMPFGLNVNTQTGLITGRPRVAGSYAIRTSATNALGTDTRTVSLTVEELPAGREFRITNLGNVASRLDGNRSNGGLAVSPGMLVHAGRTASQAYPLHDADVQVASGPGWEGLCSDLGTGSIYTLALDGQPFRFGDGRVNQLLELDPRTIRPTGRVIALSEPVPLPAPGGIFSGNGRVVLHNGAAVHDILLPSGQVTNLGPLDTSDWLAPGTFWAVCGVAEFFAGRVHLVYRVADRNAIVRRRVPDGYTETIAPSVGFAANFAVATFHSTWYAFDEDRGVVNRRHAEFEIGAPTAPPVITSSLAATHIPTVPFDYQIEAGGLPTTFGASGLPDGMQLDPTTGRITGDHPTIGTYPVTISATNALGTTTATLTLDIIPALASFFDDFDPDIDSYLWAEFGGLVEANTVARESGAGSSGRSLWFGGPGDRFARTIPVNTSQPGGVSFRFASGTGWTDWREVPAGHEVIVEYSVDGGRTFTPTGHSLRGEAWRSVVFPFPTDAVATQFRFRQLRPDPAGNSAGNWAIEDIYIGPLQALPDNEAPAFAGTSLRAVAGFPLVIREYQLLNLASDPDGDRLAIRTVEPESTLGAPVTRGGGAITYHPPPDLATSDQLSFTITDGHVETPATVDVQVAPLAGGDPGTPAPAISVLPGGSVQVTFAGVPHWTFGVERSTNLDFWFQIRAVTADAEGKVVFADPFPRGSGAFYRLVFPPH